MIFVAVGTVHGFDRMVRLIDEWAVSGRERVVAQIGDTSYVPRHCEWFRFDTPGAMHQHIQESRAVVAHCGVGMVLDVLDRGKRLVIVPRLKALGEHIDDHQLELGQHLSDEGLATVVQDAADLDRALIASGAITSPRSPRPELARAVASVLADWNARISR